MSIEFMMSDIINSKELVRETKERINNHSLNKGDIPNYYNKYNLPKFHSFDLERRNIKLILTYNDFIEYISVLSCFYKNDLKNVLSDIILSSFLHGDIIIEDYQMAEYIIEFFANEDSRKSNLFCINSITKIIDLASEFKISSDKLIHIFRNKNNSEPI